MHSARHASSLALVAASFWLALGAAPVQSQGAGPRFRADGKDAEAMGQKEGYPHCTGAEYASQQRCRVGAFSNFDKLFPTRSIAAPRVASTLKRAVAEPDIRYSFVGQTNTLDRYLALHPVTALLIAKGDTILVERYQYGRTDKHLMTSFSMAKTITAMLIGIAVKEGHIRSITDMAETYVPGLKGTEYGRTPIKALLQMSSGIRYDEAPRNPDSDAVVLARGTLIGEDPGGALSTVKRFNSRVTGPGQRFNYSSAETQVLGLILTHATRQTAADYTREKIWEPLGAEAEAKWSIDRSGHEVTYAYFNATLRDWARLGLMLASDGSWNGKSIVPKDWLLAATSVAPGEERLKNADLHQNLGYGYQTWLLPGSRRAFALQGARGQWLVVEPESKLVMVQFNARPANDPAADREMLRLWDAMAAQLR